MTKRLLTSAQFMRAAYAAIDTITLAGRGGDVTTKDIARAELLAETVFDDRIRIVVGETEADNLSNVELVPNYKTEVLTINCKQGEYKMSIDLYLGDYGVDLVKTEA